MKSVQSVAFYHGWSINVKIEDLYVSCMRHCHCPAVISATPPATHNWCPRLDLDSTMSRKLKIYIQNCQWHTRLSWSWNRDKQNNLAIQIRKTQIIFGDTKSVVKGVKVELRNHNNSECSEAALVFAPRVRVGHWARSSSWAGTLNTRASNEGSRRLREVLQSRRMTLLLGPSPGWKHLLALSHLRHYSKEAPW